MTTMTNSEVMAVLDVLVEREFLWSRPESAQKIKEARAHIAEALREREWRPIESAPTEIDSFTSCGQQVLLGAPGWVDVGFYHDGSHCYGRRGEAGWFAAEDWGADRLLTASNLHPTHWQPLPEPPK